MAPLRLLALLFTLGGSKEACLAGSEGNCKEQPDDDQNHELSVSLLQSNLQRDLAAGALHAAQDGQQKDGREDKQLKSPAAAKATVTDSRRAHQESGLQSRFLKQVASVARNKGKVDQHSARLAARERHGTR
eukprot:TRINITY_DN3908_c0_g2_i1.p1 TRINITY_DN3908_c0_g2~~TRINITY_DN3908_c0_g2_i1.p1  ORF type:complete len:132 (+),score=37.90 TRINITY_DN3908_c0_g2_i1:85-480(+)